MGPLDPAEPLEEEEKEVIKVSRQGGNAEKPSRGMVPGHHRMFCEPDTEATSSVLGGRNRYQR